jgi:hypothetical protein
MAFTERHEHKIEVLPPYSVLQCRRANIVEKDGVEVGKTYHRHVRVPGDDMTDECPEMQAVAAAQLQAEGYDEGDSYVGFHVPPFISVPHLHMHVISPATQILSGKRFKYVPGSCWFWTSDRVLEKLEARSCLQWHMPW